MTPELSRRSFLLGTTALIGGGGLWLKFSATPRTEAQATTERGNTQNPKPKLYLSLAVSAAGFTSGQGPATPVSAEIRTPTPTPTPRPEVTPTPTRPPTTEGKPTLSPEVHFARLKTVDSITFNGITTSIRRTDAALVWADFFTPQLKDNYARTISQNIANVADKTIREVAVVFVKNRGDSPILINDPNVITMGGFSVRNQNGSLTYCGIWGYKKFDGRLVMYYGLEEGFDTSDAVAVDYRDWGMGNRSLRYTKDGESPINGILFTQEEISLLNQKPIRVRN